MCQTSLQLYKRTGEQQANRTNMIWIESSYFFLVIYIYNTYKKEYLLTCSANSSQETAPIEAYDTPLDLAYNVEQARGMRFPNFFVTLE